MNSLRRLGSKLSRQFNLSYHDSNTATVVLDKNEGWEPYDPAAYEKADENHSYSVDEPSFQSKNGDPNQHRQEPADSSEWFPQSFDPGWEDIVNYDEKDKPPASTLDGLRSPYGCGAARFEPHFGISLQSRDRNPNPEATKVKVDNSYEAMLQEANADLEAVYLESLGLPTKHQNKSSPTISAPNPAAFLEISVTKRATTPGHLGSSPAGPQNCIICVEDFSATVRAPGWISLACQHKPSVCSDCVARSIKSDLESRMWDDIRCPECKEKLIYDDIQGLADPETFARYNEISLRKALEKDPNFVWCLKCNYGQLHESGESQPIVRCQACGFRTCFKHSIEWHERYTCEEYDEMLRDPDGFQTVRDREEADLQEARKFQDEEDMNLAQELTDRDRREEEERQRRRRHEEQKRIERAKQEAEIARKRQEEDIKLAQELADHDRREEEERRRRRHEEQKKIERAKQEAEIARKRQEEDIKLAQELADHDRREEEERQRRRHEEQKKIERAKQEAEIARKKKEAEAARKREERQRAEEEQRKRRLEEERRAARAKEEAEARKKSEARAKQVEALKRKQKEEAASLAKIQNTTKRCPGCSWPIEKNDGCDHMTCIKCKRDFCWLCLQNWGTHGASCS